MPDKVFIDTNILVYSLSADSSRSTKAREALLSSPEAVISSQVINEFINTCLKKNLLSIDDAAQAANGFMRALHFAPVHETTINRALRLVKKYKYSFWDSLIVASALENSCSVLLTEDLQHGQVINNRLKIVNPFH
jgi:predicted nucleic acid-binding protein